MKYLNPDIFLYIGRADAYAMATEYIRLPRDKDVHEQALLFTKYVKHPTHDIPPGNYTDDTEMSAANAHVLTEEDLPYTPLMFADAYVREFQRGKGRKGYSRKFQDFLESTKDGEDFLKNINPHSDKNGAAMRAVPIGALPDINDVLSVATLQARITHDTLEGRFSARAVALMSHFALYEDLPLDEIPGYCLTYLPEEDVKLFGHVFTERWDQGPVTARPGLSVAITTVHAVVDLLIFQPSLMKMLAQTIRWRGDTDSVAAILWGIASCRHRNEQIPEFMTNHLENGNPLTGAPYLKDIGSKLMEKFQ